MNPFSRSSVLAVLLSVAAGSAFAHAKLVTSEPAAEATVAAPSVVKLHFNEAVEAAMSKVKLSGPVGALEGLAAPAPEAGDDKTLLVTLPKLSAGRYQLTWSTMGHDGHHTQGTFQFTVQ